MELKKIQYRSAVFFCIIALVIYLIMGIVQLVVKGMLLKQIGQIATDQLPTQIQQYAQALTAITPMSALVIGPIIAGIVCYLLAVLAIFIYNLIAKKYPISWEVAK